jgi:hypothetical protein
MTFQISNLQSLYNKPKLLSLSFLCPPQYSVFFCSIFVPGVGQPIGPEGPFGPRKRRPTPWLALELGNWKTGTTGTKTMINPES